VAPAAIAGEVVDVRELGVREVIGAH